MTRKEFLDDLIAFYSADPVGRRSVGVMRGGCYYRGSNGRKCAIGRYIPNYQYSGKMEGLIVSATAVWKALPESIRALEAPFLIACQNLHDEARFWSANGLTKAGVRAVSAIRAAYAA